jgi:hypothetical protein
MFVKFQKFIIFYKYINNIIKFKDIFFNVKFIVYEYF